MMSPLPIRLAFFISFLILETSVLASSDNSTSKENSTTVTSQVREKRRAPETPDVNGCYNGTYIGKKQRTKEGYKCQRWDSQYPHTQDFHSKPWLFPGRDVAHNYCRNPDGETSPWCYTRSFNKRWDYCEVPDCRSHDSTGKKICSDGLKFNNGSCEDIDECDEGVLCKNGYCENLYGGYKCHCGIPSVYNGTHCNDCGYYGHLKQGTIKSPSYHLQTGAICHWTIEVGEGKRVKLHFKHWAGSMCPGGMLEIYEKGNYETTFCSGRPRDWISKTNEIEIRMTAKSVWEEFSFSLDFSGIDKSDCDKKFAKRKDSFTWPNMPLASLRCDYVIYAPEGVTINLVLSGLDDQHLSVFCHANVEIYSGTVHGKRGEREYLFGMCIPNRKKTMTFNATGGMTVRFKGNGYQNGTFPNFRASYTTNQGDCGYTFKQASPHLPLNSPGYPDNYPNDLMCEYWIQAQHGYTIKITIRDYDIEGLSATDEYALSDSCIYDTLVIYDGINEFWPNLTVLCGKGSNLQVQSTVSDVYIVFKTDFTIRHKGFHAEYEFIKDEQDTEYPFQAGDMYCMNCCWHKGQEYMEGPFPDPNGVDFCYCRDGKASCSKAMEPMRGDYGSDATTAWLRTEYLFHQSLLLFCLIIKNY